jgi:hypothetical protein
MRDRGSRGTGRREGGGVREMGSGKTMESSVAQVSQASQESQVVTFLSCTYNGDTHQHRSSGCSLHAGRRTVQPAPNRQAEPPSVASWTGARLESEGSNDCEGQRSRMMSRWSRWSRWRQVTRAAPCSRPFRPPTCAVALPERPPIISHDRLDAGWANHQTDIQT